MPPATHLARPALLSALSLFCLLVGCQQAEPGDEMAMSRLGGVAEVYTKYRATHSGQRPKDLSVLKAFATERGGYTLERFGLSDADSLFISERDQQPYQLFFGDPLPEYEGQMVIGWESEGVGGTKIVAFENGGVQKLGADEVARFKN